MNRMCFDPVSRKKKDRLDALALSRERELGSETDSEEEENLSKVKEVHSAYPDSHTFFSQPSQNHDFLCLKLLNISTNRHQGKHKYSYQWNLLVIIGQSAFCFILKKEHPHSVCFIVIKSIPIPFVLILLIFHIVVFIILVTVPNVCLKYIATAGQTTQTLQQLAKLLKHGYYYFKYMKFDRKNLFFQCLRVRARCRGRWLAPCPAAGRPG